MGKNTRCRGDSSGLNFNIKLQRKWGCCMIQHPPIFIHFSSKLSWISSRSDIIHQGGISFTNAPKTSICVYSTPCFGIFRGGVVYIISFSSNFVGYHHKVISSEVRGYHPSRMDIIRKCAKKPSICVYCTPCF